MTPWVHHILAAALTAAIKVLPEPGERPWWRVFHGRNATLNYKISQQELSAIFRTYNTVYVPDQTDSGVGVRHSAGHSYTGAHQEVHGFGETRALHAHHFSIFINTCRTGIFSNSDGFLDGLRHMMAHVQSTVRNLPGAFINSREFKALFLKAHQHETPRSLCEVSVAAQTAPGSSNPLFIMQAAYMADPQQVAPVTIHRIARPVLDQDGQIHYGQVIRPDSPDRERETLKFLILVKLLAHQIAYNQAIDLKENLIKVNSMKMDRNSRIKDYMTLQPHP